MCIVLQERCTRCELYYYRLFKRCQGTEVFICTLIELSVLAGAMGPSDSLIPIFVLVLTETGS